MTKYREIIRLKGLDFSERNIARSCNVSRNTVSRVIKKADELNIAWPLDEFMTDSVLEKLLFQKKNQLQINVCLIWRTSTRSYSETESVKSFYGPNTVRTVV